MKCFAVLAFFLFALSLLPARAQQNPDDQYIIIYSLIQQADSLLESGRPRQALTEFQQIQADLEKFQKIYPDWNPTIVDFRLKYIGDQIAGLTPSMTATNAPSQMPSTNSFSSAAAGNFTADLQSQVALLRQQVQQLQEANQQLQSANQLLQQKLQEALSAQPPASDAQALAQTQERVRALMKENDLLRASAAAKNNPVQNAAAQTELLKVQQELADAKQNLAEQKDRANKLAMENQILQAKLQPFLTSKNGAMDALRKENAMLKKEVADLNAGALAVGDSPELLRARAQIAALQSDAEIHALERRALEDRLQKFLNAPAGSSMSAVANEEISKLRARLAVDEAQAVPYTPEELALLQSAPPAPAMNAVASATENSAGDSLQNSSDVSPLVAEAQKYFDNHDYANAEADYQRILQQDKNNSAVLANLAAIELEENKLDAAGTHISAALAINPNDAYALSAEGYLYFREQKLDAALDVLSRAARLDPQNPQIENYLGVTLSHKGLRDAAEKALRRAIELDPNYAAAHNNLAMIFLNDNPPEPQLARSHYQKALDNGQPRNPDLEKLLAEKGAPIQTP